MWHRSYEVRKHLLDEDHLRVFEKAKADQSVESRRGHLRFKTINSSVRIHGQHADLLDISLAGLMVRIEDPTGFRSDVEYETEVFPGSPYSCESFHLKAMFVWSDRNSKSAGFAITSIDKEGIDSLLSFLTRLMDQEIAEI